MEGAVMAQDSLTELPLYDSLRPIARQIKWWIVGAVVVLLGLWDLAFHLFLMRLPMAMGHRLNVLMAAILVAVTVLALFRIIQQYEQQLASAAVALREKNEALRALESERDTGILDLARDLALVLVDLMEQCEVARKLTDPARATEALARVEERAHELQSVLRSLIDLREDGAGLTEYLSPVLDDYCERRTIFRVPHNGVERIVP
jgi:hypothetical protein